jgi:hypothetical protein
MVIRACCVAFLSVLVFSGAVFAACPVERGPVKTVTDTQALQVRLVPIPTTIGSLHSYPPAPRPLPHDARIAPVETTIESVTATLIAFRLTPQAEIQLVLSDEARRTILATIPSPACASGSRFLSQITNARRTFDGRYTATEAFTEVRKAVEVQGVGFFDFFQSQRGLAPNGLSLYPVTAIDFMPVVRPVPPPPTGRRRSVGSGERGCPRPSLVVTASRFSACMGERVAIAWQASDALARVTIDGVGVSLPAAGSQSVTAGASTVYAGRAVSPCGTSDEALAVLTLTPGATATLNGPSTVTAGGTATLAVAVSGVTSWMLSSSLRNAISPFSGTASGTASYAGTHSGTDTVTLATTGGTCANLARTLSIRVNEPVNSGLRCCDGTRSPSCFNCANKSGCCSGHRGVCDCL